MLPNFSSVIINKNNQYQWNLDYQQLSQFHYRPNIYYDTDDAVYLFYMTYFYENSLKTHKEVITYFMLQNLSKLNSYESKIQNRKCDFCNKIHYEKHIIIKKYGFEFFLCCHCRLYYNYQKMIINPHQGYSHPFGLIENKLEVSVKINNQVVFFFKKKK